jgi:hypothetical protein
LATVKVAAAVIELDKLSLGPPKSRAGQRTVALPRQLVDELQRHLDKLGGKGTDATSHGTPNERDAAAHRRERRP